MTAKYNELRKRLKKHMEDANGLKAWKSYYGSQLEADIVYFIEKELLLIAEKAIDDTFNQVHYSTLHPDKFPEIEHTKWREKWIAENVTPHPAP